MKRILFVFILMHTILFASSQKNESGYGWYVKDYTEDVAKAYFDSRYSLDLIEGIWQSTDGFKYSIEKDFENGQRSKNKYRVIVLESSHNGWETTELKGFISYSSVNNIYSLKYYTKDQHGMSLSSQNVFMMVENPLLVSFKRIDGGKISLFKLYPKAIESPNSNYIEPNSSTTETWSGSSIVIGNRYLATNYHVVEGAKTLTISGSLDNYTANYKATVIATDKATDLAILKVTDSSFKGFKTPEYGIRTTTVDVGTEVFVLGYPLTSTMGKEVKLTTGVVSSKTGFLGDVSSYQISAPIQPGNSGGPLFDNYGNLIGIVNAKHKDTENVGYAIKLTYLKNLIESCNDKIEYNFSNTISEISLSDKVKAITPYVYIVTASTLSNNVEDSSNANHNETYINNNISAQEYYNKARQMYEDKRYEEAYNFVRKSVAISPNKENHYLCAVLGNLLEKDENIVIESAQYCIEQRYQQENSWFLIANTYYSQKKWTEAIKAYSKVLSFDRTNIKALYWRGLSKSRNGDKEAALADYKTALQFEDLISFDYSAIYNVIAYQQLCNGDLENAHKNSIEAITRNHLDGNNWDTYGEIMYKLGNYNECIKYMGAAITCAAGEDKHWLDNSYYYRGLANQKLGFGSDALEDLERALELGNEKADSILQTDILKENNFKSGKFFNMHKSPSIYYKTDTRLKIIAIQSTEEYTTIYFTYSLAWDGSYAINKDAYIWENDSNEKLYLIGYENITINPKRTNLNNGETATFSLTFPAISNTCTKLNFSEGNNVNDWRLIGIDLGNNEPTNKKRNQIETKSTREVINWEDVIITEDIEQATKLKRIEQISQTYYGDITNKSAIQKTLQKIQKIAAKKGCCLALVSKKQNPLGIEFTAILYKRP